MSDTYYKQGFTIVEVLVAVVLFAVEVLVVLAPLTGLFGITKWSTTQITATNQAQQWVEQVKGQWQNPVNYNSACINSSSTLPSTVSISIQDEDLQQNSVNSPYNITVSTNCTTVAAQSAPAPLRLIKVTSIINSIPSTLTVEVPQ